jgi:hypothetical protein
MKFCPNCGHDLSQYNNQGSASPALPVDKPYNQTDLWRGLVARAQAVEATPPAPESLVLPVVERVRDWGKGRASVTTIIHLVFDRDIAPRGGALHQITMSEGRVPMDAARLEMMGYDVRGGKVVTIDDIPVGPAYSLVNYWGGDRQHKRWHMVKPCEINPSRNGDPLFMDATMMAIRVSWRDLEKIDAALFELLEMFTKGFGQHLRPIAVPLVLEVTVH